MNAFTPVTVLMELKQTRRLTVLVKLLDLMFMPEALDTETMRVLLLRSPLLAVPTF